MSPKSAQSTGFTLVELIVSVTIIAVLSGALIPTFSNFLNSQNLRQTQEQLKSDMRSLQGKSLAGTLSDSLISGSEVTHWGLRTTQDSSVYYYFLGTVATVAECNNYNAGGRNQGSATLPSTMTFTGTGCVFFSFADGSITATGAHTTSNAVIFGYTNRASGNCRRVQFNGPGLLYTVNTTVAGNCN